MVKFLSYLLFYFASNFRYFMQGHRVVKHRIQERQFSIGHRKTQYSIRLMRVSQKGRKQIKYGLGSPDGVTLIPLLIAQECHL